MTNHFINSYMKKVKYLSFAFALVLVSFLLSCGGDSGGSDDPSITDGQALIDALTSGNWSVNESASDVSNVTGSPGLSDLTIDFSETSSGASFDLVCEISNYISGGSFAVSDEAVISSIAVDPQSSDITVTGADFDTNADNTEVTVTVTTSESSSARSTGVGTYTLVFDAGS